MDEQPTWDWSSLRDRATAWTSGTDSGAESTNQTGQSEPQSQSSQQPRDNPNARRYGPRSCRICLDTEQPKFPTDTTTTFGISPTSSRPTYVSDDPELGRLLSPCKCKGSQKYVHEGCLNAWRLANPTATRNYWQCPTCKFTYRMSRLHWAAILSSRVAQIALTLFILLVSIFILGFIADPLFDLWYDPFGTLTDTVAGVINDIEARNEPPWEPPATWGEHFAKGFFSLGLVGFFKTMFAMTPWQWFNLRNTGVLGGTGRRQGTGRGRVENMSWFLILVGAITFLMGIWKFVKMLSARVLKNFSDKVLDIHNDDDDDEDEEPVANDHQRDKTD
ncbi:unnamed protein product [Clonostachys rosea]|uniref:RING-CH-type domain-containing protein n=1 Tax=Bionectria ochroleuca TaxID=29856 RepID=A0ABY6UT90_BIOOC|nr:unnamed protein product [Clonostachys rosea]